MFNDKILSLKVANFRKMSLINHNHISTGTPADSMQQNHDVGGCKDDDDGGGGGGYCPAAVIHNSPAIPQQKKPIRLRNVATKTEAFDVLYSKRNHVSFTFTYVIHLFFKSVSYTDINHNK